MNAIPRRLAAATLPFCTLLFLFSALLLHQDNTVADDRERISEVCLDCHDDKLPTLFGSTHQILDDNLDDPTARVACTDCHLGDEAHWDDDPDDNPMPSLTGDAASTTEFVCRQCHQNSHQLNMQERNVHAENDVNCTNCHQVHNNAHESLLRKTQTELCYECHTSVRGDFARPYRHPVADGVMKCSECHRSLDVTRMELSYNGANTPCYECHREFQGPFPFEHQATVDYSTDEGGCLTCHDPHGSSLPRMLKQSYEAPNYNLCTQCHSVPLHNLNSQHGTTWAGVPCNDCHVDIHGSYTNRRYFSPALEAQGCMVFACHAQ